MIHLLSFSLDPEALSLRVLLWPLLFGLGAYLLLTAQPLGRPKPDLLERLRRLDVDERLRAEQEKTEVQPLFASRWLERMLRPILEDAGSWLRAAFQRLGLGGGQELERRLRLARPEVGPVQFFGEKLVSGLIGLGFFPLMNAFGIHPFGDWPFWMGGLGFAVGFLAPDWELDRRVSAYRRAVQQELPVLLDLLTIAASAGVAPEQAIAVVAERSQGVLAHELQQTVREMALGRQSLVEAVEAMAHRSDVPELERLAGQLRAVHEQGVPLVQMLSAQAEALREQQRHRILEEGGKASVRMILPVALFILPVVFVVLVFPALVQLMHLGG